MDDNDDDDGDDDDDDDNSGDGNDYGGLLDNIRQTNRCLRVAMKHGSKNSYSRYSLKYTFA